MTNHHHQKKLFLYFISHIYRTSFLPLPLADFCSSHRFNSLLFYSVSLSSTHSLSSDNTHYHLPTSVYFLPLPFLTILSASTSVLFYLLPIFLSSYLSTSLSSYLPAFLPSFLFLILYYSVYFSYFICNIFFPYF